MKKIFALILVGLLGGCYVYPTTDPGPSEDGGIVPVCAGKVDGESCSPDICTNDYVCYQEECVWYVPIVCQTETTLYSCPNGDFDILLDPAMLGGGCQANAPYSGQYCDPGSSCWVVVAGALEQGTCL